MSATDPDFFSSRAEVTHDVSARMLAGLNPEQLAAVTLPHESSLILAGAGSGKTRVLTTRIAWLIQTGQLHPAGVMAVTFTNKAAKEMLTRLGAMLAFPVRGMWIGTFHGLCNRFLRTHWKRAGLPQQFQILDTSDQLSAVKRVIKGMQLDEERFPPKQVSYFIANCKEAGQRPAAVSVRDDLTRVMVQVYEAYEAQCAREGVVDFAELMLRTYEIMRDDDALREHYRQRFTHVLVDEFQDTNRLQYAWLKMFAGPATAVMAVGDDDQSIYAFRGAQVGNMASFEREFRVARVIKLEQNYRSFGNILDAANGLIAHNSQRLGKNLRTDAGSGEPIRVQEAPTDFAEAQWLVEEVRQLHREGMALHDIAVLYRSNAQSRVLENALFAGKVPYKVYGGLRFFERAEIKHALAYLRLIANPNDDTSFLRVVNFPARGIGGRTVEQLQDAAKISGRSLAQSVSALTGAAGAKVQGFVALLDAMRERTQGMTLRDIVAHTLDHSGLVAHYRQDKEGEDRLENLDELLNAAEAFVVQEGFGRDVVALPLDELAGATAGGSNPVNLLPDAETGEIMSPLAAFLTHASLEAGDNQAQSGQDALQLMTVHASKGLEFDAVFITGLEEALFPHDNSSSDDAGLEEERRLMYVAITRARQRLYLSHAQTRMLHGQTRYNMPSRFLGELPEGTLRWLSPRRAPSSGGLDLSGGWHRSGGQAWGGRGQSQPAWSAPTRPVAAPLTMGQGPAYGSPATTRSDTHGLKSGQGVFHTKFGEGVILTIEGVGDDARAQVNFGRHGTKWLALSVAKLTPLP